METAGNDRKAQERRRAYRHPCRRSTQLTQPAEILDLSASGASVAFAQDLPRGTHVWLCVARGVPELASVEGEVVGSREQGGRFVLHLLFVNLTRAAERELNRHLINLQTGRSR